MKYDKNDLFGTKGRIGELIYQIFVFVMYGWICEEGPELQKKGVDFIVKEQFMKKSVDVKFSDALEDYFHITCANSNGPRFPIRSGGEAAYVEVVTFDWDGFVDTNANKLKKEVSTKELAIEKLLNYMTREECDYLVQKLENNEKRDTYTDLLHLLVAHHTIQRLECELKNKQTFQDFEELMKDYIMSIDEVLVSDILNLTRGFDSWAFGESRVDGKGNKLVTKKRHYTRYGDITAAEVYWAATSSENLFSNQNKPHSKINFNKKLIRGKYKGKSLIQIHKEENPTYLDWYIEQVATNPKSLFPIEFNTTGPQLVEELLILKARLESENDLKA